MTEPEPTKTSICSASGLPAAASSEPPTLTTVMLTTAGSARCTISAMSQLPGGHGGRRRVAGRGQGGDRANGQGDA